MTVQNGNDPRDLAVFAYGGAGPLHAAVLARELGASDVVVPLGDLGSVWSAFGAAIAGPATSAYGDEIHPIPADPAKVRAHLERLTAVCHERLDADGVSAEGRETAWSVTMKYAFQVHVISVSIDDDLFAGDFNADLLARLKSEYERIFGPGTSYADAGAEIVSFEARVSQASPHRFPLAAAGDESVMRPASEREVYWRTERDFVATPVIRPESVVPGARIDGPALIELTHTTIAVDPRASARVDPSGNIHIRVEPVGAAVPEPRMTGGRQA
jgi:N-methylhydantoinase A